MPGGIEAAEPGDTDGLWLAGKPRARPTLGISREVNGNLALFGDVSLTIDCTRIFKRRGKDGLVSTPQTPWRDIGDTTFAAFAAELARLNSPMHDHAVAIYEESAPHTLLAIAHSFAENKHDTVGILIKPDMKNFLALRPRGYPEETGQRNNFATFASYTDCVRAWRRRHTDASIDTGRVPKNYVEAVSLQDYCTVYNPSGDTHPVTGLPNNAVRYCNELLTTINRLPLAQPNPPTFTAFATPRVFHVRQGTRATGRSAPLRDPGNIVRTFESGDAIECDGFFRGEVVEGESRWLRTSAEPQLAVHASGVIPQIE